MLAAKNPLWFNEFADRNAPLDIPFPKRFQAGAWHPGEVQYLFRTGTTEMTKDPVDYAQEHRLAFWEQLGD